jgi:hypothetical protein
VVATGLGISTESVREEWQHFDLITADGLKIEVKSAAYIQSWHQRGLSKIVFGVPETCAWEAETNTWSKEKKRQADVYVFALLKHEEKESIDPLNMDQWEFFVCSARAIGERTREGKSVSLKMLEVLGCGAVKFGELKKALEVVNGTNWTQAT